jgi:predicted PurR-regulated permease PerM
LQRALILLLLGVTLVAIMYYGSFFWLPMVFGALLGMLFLPLIRRLRRWGLPDWIALGICGFVLVLIFGILIGVVSYQVNAVAQKWPQVQAELAAKGEVLREVAIDNFGLSANRLDAILAQARQGQRSLQSIIGNVLGSFFSSTTNVLLTLVYMFFLLLTRHRIKEFILRLLPPISEILAGQ